MPKLNRTAVFLAATALFALACGAHSNSTSPPASVSPSLACAEEQGDLVEYLVRVEAGLPRADSGAYTDPASDKAATLVQALQRMRQGDCAGAVALAAAADYEAVRFIDLGAEDQPYFILRQRAPCAPACWGLVILRPKPARPLLIIEAPHPLFDIGTPRFAAEAYRHSGATALLMAGTHRYASCLAESCPSDVAHNASSLFQLLHEALVDGCSVVVQYHGFARTPSRPDYPQVVLSNGTGGLDSGLAAFRRELIQRGLSAEVFDGERFKDLGATSNAQGQQARSKGSKFYHLENDPRLRADPALRAAAVEALLAAHDSSELADPACVTPGTR